VKSAPRFHGLVPPLLDVSPFTNSHDVLMVLDDDALFLISQRVATPTIPRD
jgi:hypothetical protein